MHFSNIFTISALAMTAAALPTAETVDLLAPRTGGGTETSCSNTGQKTVCCDSLLAILCTVSVLGGTCQSSSFCCSTDAAPGTLINIQLLNCLKL
ncbi:hypothetical protein C8A00DRAFT_31159 [Chaetomidium leptoderma]|uniref:Hydrophobin n=1 Tax=Chaetomidium leptoderma TaxID=669021 RepID=A0AAN6VSD7_9PEZI|nr:hypothetical protein C8A00DRAFT_31159 [Chaetomidium leptoderma]